VRSIVIAAHEEVDPVITHQVEESMLLRDSTGPDVRTQVPERFWLSDSAEGVTYHRFDEIQHTEGNAPVDIDPVPEIFPKLVLKDTDSRFLPGSGFTRAQAPL
jgi:hypothetical protein